MSKQVFDINISCDVSLEEHEVWPDGDAPENPTAADVIAAMKATGTKHRMLADWELLHDVEIDVFDGSGGTASWGYGS